MRWSCWPEKCVRCGPRWLTACPIAPESPAFPPRLPLPGAGRRGPRSDPPRPQTGHAPPLRSSFSPKPSLPQGRRIVTRLTKTVAASGWRRGRGRAGVLALKGVQTSLMGARVIGVRAMPLPHLPRAQTGGRLMPPCTAGRFAPKARGGVSRPDLVPCFVNPCRPRAGAGIVVWPSSRARSPLVASISPPICPSYPSSTTGVGLPGAPCSGNCLQSRPQTRGRAQPAAPPRRWLRSPQPAGHPSATPPIWPETGR